MTVIFYSLPSISLVSVSRRSQGSQPDNKHSDWSEDSEEVPKTADDTEKEQVGKNGGRLGRGGWGALNLCAVLQVIFNRFFLLVV